MLHLGAGQLLLMCFGPVWSAVMNGRLMSYCCVAGKRDLGFFGFFLDALKGVGLLAQIHAAVFLEFVEDPIHEAIVPVVTAEVRVAVGGLDLENAVADFQHGNIERAAAQIVDRDLFVLLLVQAVGERGRRRLVDDAQNFQAGDLARRLWWPGVANR